MCPQIISRPGEACFTITVFSLCFLGGLLIFMGIGKTFYSTKNDCKLPSFGIPMIGIGIFIWVIDFIFVQIHNNITSRRETRQNNIAFVDTEICEDRALQNNSQQINPGALIDDPPPSYESVCQTYDPRRPKVNEIPEQQSSSSNQIHSPYKI